MRLDYFCQLTVYDHNGKLIPPKKLKRLDGYIDKSEGADLTLHMDQEQADKLIGENIRFIFKVDRLYARASLHEKGAITAEDETAITDYVRGQFLDGYGEDQLEIRKWGKSYFIDFADKIDGPVKVNIAPPEEKPKKEDPESDLRKFQQSVMEGNLEKVKEYIESGINVNAVPRQIDSISTEMSALGWAANRDHFDIASYLLNLGADPNVPSINTYGKTDGTPIFFARPRIAKLLLAAGADVRIKNAEGRNCLEQITYELDWHKAHYDPDSPMARFNDDAIADLESRLSTIRELIA